MKYPSLHFTTFFPIKYMIYCLQLHLSLFLRLSLPALLAIEVQVTSGPAESKLESCELRSELLVPCLSRLASRLSRLVSPFFIACSTRDSVSIVFLISCFSGCTVLAIDEHFRLLYRSTAHCVCCSRVNLFFSPPSSLFSRLVVSIV